MRDLETSSLKNVGQDIFNTPPIATLHNDVVRFLQTVFSQAGLALLRKRVLAKYGKKNLGPYSDFDWGMINGKLSALRWVLGDDWDMLDT